MFLMFVAVLFLSQYVVTWVYDIFILLLMLGAGYEMSKAIGNKYKKPMYGLIVAFILIGYAAFKTVHTMNALQHGNGSGGITAFFVMLVVMFVVCFIVNMASSKHTFENVISTFMCMIYPVGIMVYFLGLNYFPGASEGLAFTGWTYDAYANAGAFTPNFRPISIIMTFACASGADIMALFVGKLIGGPKLAPAISPKKTVAGAIGGLFGGIISAIIVFGIAYTGAFGLTQLHEKDWISLILYVVLGLSIAIATEIGDLMASYTKRFCEIKDYGTLIPGHGGVLDRIDGALLGAMVTYLYFTVMISLG